MQHHIPKEIQHPISKEMLHPLPNEEKQQSLPKDM